jgi:hypothetical protein
MAMIRFSKFIGLQEESGRSKGEALEHAIVSAINGKEKKISGIPFGAGAKIAKKLSLNGDAEVLGAGTFDVTEIWSQYWPGGKVPSSTKTPKTDIRVGPKRISIKAGDSAQLMSGGRLESIATFFAATDRLGIDAEKNAIYAKIANALEGLAGASTADSELGAEIKKGKDKVVLRANEAHKIIQKDLNQLFNSNPNFAYEFCYEAMTGEVKFGTKSPASCTHFLTSDFEGDKAHLVPISNAQYISKVAGRAKVSVRFKTTSEKKTVGGVKSKTGRYKYWSVVGLVVDKLNEELEAHDGVLTENVIKTILDKVKNFLKNIINKVVNYIRKSIYNLLDFLGLEPSISFNNKVSFEP